MHFGYDIPTRGPLASPENISSIAQRGEALGFGTAYVNDHIVVPRDIASRYPYSEGGDWAGGQFGEAMDILSMLAFLAAATSKVRLLTSVMVVPYRHPLVTVARQLVGRLEQVVRPLSMVVDKRTKAVLVNSSKAQV